jgi:hypothetical protein
MRTRKPFPRTLFFLFLLICLLGGLIGVAGVPVEAAPKLVPSTTVVISQVYGGGGNAGAPYTNDFVELFNLSTSPVSVDGWSVQYAAAGGTSWTVTGLTGSLAAGQYYLVQLGSGGAIGSPLPTFDASGTANLSATAGKVALVNTTTALSGDCPIDASVVDFVGFGGTASCFEGTAPTSAPSNTTAILRTGSGCVDTDSNSSDFTAGPPSPRNSSSIGLICGVGTYTPTITPIPLIDVIINEVAWAGTRAFAGDEWIELYNDGTLTADLTNWRLEAADGDPIIDLSGYTIPAKGYLLLERGSPNVTNVFTSGNVVTATYFSGLLNNAGETLYLLDENSQVVSTVNSNGGAWPAGGGSPNFPTMERLGNVPDSDFVWLTFAGTPSALDAGGNPIYGTPGDTNWAFGQIPTPSPTLTFTPLPTNTATLPPSATPAGFLSVVINEVAWMGTLASTADEWIELYNPGSTAINITGWTLRGLDGTPNITLNGTIPAGGYFILERSDDNTISDVTANQIFTGDLGNTNEVLQLIDSSNRTIDTANANGGPWPAGSTSTYGSMERRGVVADSDTAWITNANPASWTKHDARGTTSTSFLIRGTPGYANWAISVTATSSPRPTATRTPIRTSTPAPPPPPPLVAINEFVPRPGSDWNGDGVINTGDEYIELLNHGVVPVNLGGYRLDDEVNIGSSPFALPAVTLQPGERIVFYGSDTGLLLGDGGDGVRLLRPNGTLMDAYNYFVVNRPDQAFCRLPDNGGADDWNTNCYPTPGLPNSFSGAVLRPPTEIDSDHPLCPIADTLPEEFALAECTPFGNNIWNRYYWDRFGWFGESPLLFLNGKWEVYAD